MLNKIFILLYLFFSPSLLFTNGSIIKRTTNCKDVINPTIINIITPPSCILFILLSPCIYSASSQKASLFCSIVQKTAQLYNSRYLHIRYIKSKLSKHNNQNDQTAKPMNFRYFSQISSFITHISY